MMLFFIFQLGGKMEIIQMSQKELERSRWIIKAVESKITQKEASQKMGLSVRQTKRLCKRYKEKSIAGLAHLNRGKPSNNKIPKKIRDSIEKIILTHYSDFGPQLVQEQLEEKHKLKFSREWIRQFMIEIGVWKSKKRKQTHYYQRRARRSQKGELIQIDGSYHDWFEGRAPKCCLLVFVDDATGKIQEAQFVDHENTVDYMASMKSYIKKKGRPLAVYSDRHAIFKGDKNDSQFTRALRELDIELIYAYSPQAKGRVERAHGTLQDRLVKLMRLEGISTKEEANQFLKVFLRDYNQRFGRCPKDKKNAHRKRSTNQNLDRILCIKESRKVSKSLSIQFNNKTYQLVPKNDSRRLIGQKVMVYQLDSEIQIEYRGQLYDHTIYDEQPYMVMDRKRIDAFLDRKKPMTIAQKAAKGIAINF